MQGDRVMTKGKPTLTLQHYLLIEQNIQSQYLNQDVRKKYNLVCLTIGRNQNLKKKNNETFNVKADCWVGCLLSSLVCGFVTLLPMNKLDDFSSVPHFLEPRPDLQNTGEQRRRWSDSIFILFFISRYILCLETELWEICPCVAPESFQVCSGDWRQTSPWVDEHILKE